ncbi:hypothetical protein LR48_Vigan07g241500 [Vigna angularis]|uniref:Uncharacterized protein n=1 Tax=Phaseolus angularis TaxID=3914 RepID=A0A0L9V183_PHAAN|nr:hypothetical protein LR48_Vigan07g241500 [Vigna angularis]
MPNRKTIHSAAAFLATRHRRPRAIVSIEEVGVGTFAEALPLSDATSPRLAAIRRDLVAPRRYQTRPRRASPLSDATSPRLAASLHVFAGHSPPSQQSRCSSAFKGRRERKEASAYTASLLAPVAFETEVVELFCTGLL